MKRRIRVADSFGPFYSSKGIPQTPVLVELLIEKTPVNHGRVAEMVLSALSDYNIAYNDVMGFTTDNASVMLASFRNVLKLVLLKSVHLCWLAHQMNLVVRVIIKEFPEATSWCQDFNSYFCPSGARSYRYQQHLEYIGEGRQKTP